MPLLTFKNVNIQGDHESLVMGQSSITPKVVYELQQILVNI